MNTFTSHLTFYTQTYLEHLCWREQRNLLKAEQEFMSVLATDWTTEDSEFESR
jgi:hypothetical protein